jgi:hypothetical protein
MFTRGLQYSLGYRIVLSVSKGSRPFYVEIEVPIPTPPVTSNSALGDTGDLRDKSCTGVGNGDGGGGNGNHRSLFMGPTGLSLLTGSFVYRGHAAAMTCAKFLP